MDDGRTTIGHDALLSVVDNGELVLSAGSVVVGANATLTGDGTISGDIAVHGKIATNSRPSTLATGSRVLRAGGRYEWSINDASAFLVPGQSVGWSLLAITGTLQIDATAEKPFEIDLRSLPSGNAPGAAGNFVPTEGRSWTIATATGGIGAFNPDQVFLDSTGFLNPHPGRFRLQNDGNDLNLVYTAVPELSATGIATAGVLTAALLLHRRARAVSLS